MKLFSAETADQVLSKLFLSHHYNGFKRDFNVSFGVVFFDYDVGQMSRIVSG